MAQRTKAKKAPKPKRANKKSTKAKGRTSKAASKGLNPDDFLDPRLTKAMAHRIRINIMAVISWRMIAPSEFARETREPLSRVAYHFRRLRDYGIIELEKTEQIRGSVKHFYRATRQAIFGGAAWVDLPKSVQDGVAGAALKDFTKVTVHSIESGAFSKHDESYLWWEPLIYDELAFKAAVKILATTQKRLVALQDESLPRLSKMGKDGLLVAIALSGFEMGPP